MNPPNPPSPVKSHHSPRYSYPPNPHHHHDHSPTLSSPRTFAPSSSSANAYREDANAVSSAKSPRERGPRAYYDPILDGRDFRVCHLPLFIRSPTKTARSPFLLQNPVSSNSFRPSDTSPRFSYRPSPYTNGSSHHASPQSAPNMNQAPPSPTTHRQRADMAMTSSPPSSHATAHERPPNKACLFHTQPHSSKFLIEHVVSPKARESNVAVEYCQ